MLNQVILMGRITKNPEIKSTTSGKEVVSFTLAVDRTKDETDFISCVAWDKTAKFMQTYLKQGSKIVIQGRLQTRTYDRKDGSKALATEVIVNTIDFAEAKQEKPQEPHFEEVDVDGDLPF